MTLYLKNNEILEVLLDLCRLYQLTTPIVKLEKFETFNIWIVIIDNNEKAEKIIDYLNINRYSYDILKIQEKSEAKS